MTTPSWDPKCEELARHFLQDHPEMLADGACVSTLAWEIQQCVENEILWLKHEIKARSDLDRRLPEGE